MLRQMTTETATDMVKSFLFKYWIEVKDMQKIMAHHFWFKINHPQQRQASKYNEPITLTKVVENKQEKQLRGTAGSQACRYEVKHEETWVTSNRKQVAKTAQELKSYTNFETFS